VRVREVYEIQRGEAKTQVRMNNSGNRYKIATPQKEKGLSRLGLSPLE